MRLTTSLRSPRRVPVLQVAKTTLAVALAWTVSELVLSVELPIFAAIAAIFVVQPSINQSIGRAVERSLGVVGGVVVAFLISLVFGASSWVVLLVIIFCILLAWALRLSPGSATQIPISAMLMLAIGAATASYAVDRIIETIIGAGLALVVNILIVPPVVLEPAHDSVLRLGREVANTFDRLATALETPQTPAKLQGLMIEARLLRPMLAAADRAILAAEESLTLNPRQGRHRLALTTDAELCDRLRHLVTQAIGMTRALRDHYDDSLHLEPTVQAFGTELGRASHDLRLLADQVEAASLSGNTSHSLQAAVAEPPALTAPFTIMTPHPQHWILIGSLMEDLRRVRQEIVGP